MKTILYNRYTALYTILLVTSVLLLNSCVISYKFNGASIDYSTTKTISIADFANVAALVYPPLANNLSDGIRDIFQRHSRANHNPQHRKVQYPHQAPENFARADAPLRATLPPRYRHRLRPILVYSGSPCRGLNRPKDGYPNGHRALCAPLFVAGIVLLYCVPRMYRRCRP